MISFLVITRFCTIIKGLCPFLFHFACFSPYLKNLPIMFPAKFLAKPEPLNALPAKLEAWLNLSHLENATVFVMVKANAITNNNHQKVNLESLEKSICHIPKPRLRTDRHREKEEVDRESILPFVTSQIRFCRRTSARMASAIQSAGAVYMLSQKNLLSVAFCTLEPSGALSKTQ